MSYIVQQISSQPFLIFFYILAALNLVQGTFLLYKFLKGYGVVYKKGVFLGGYIGRGTPYWPKLLVTPDKATKIQRRIILIFAILYLLSVIVLFLLIQAFIT